MEEIENPIIDSSMADPEFIDIVPQIVSFWSPEFVAALLKPLDSGQTFRLSFGLQAHNPVQDWHCILAILVENDPDYGRTPSKSAYPRPLCI